jgi:hypothetical protein
MPSPKRLVLRDAGYCKLPGATQFVIKNAHFLATFDESILLGKSQTLTQKAQNTLQTWGLTPLTYTFNGDETGFMHVAKYQNGLSVLHNATVHSFEESSKYNPLSIELSELFGVSNPIDDQTLSEIAALEKELSTTGISPKDNFFTQNPFSKKHDVHDSFRHLGELHYDEKKLFTNSPLYLASDGSHLYMIVTTRSNKKNCSGYIFPYSSSKPFIGGYQIPLHSLEGFLSSSKYMITKNRDTNQLLIFSGGKLVRETPYSLDGATPQYTGDDDVDDSMLEQFGQNLFGDWQKEAREAEIYGHSNINPIIDETFLCGDYLVGIDIQGKVFRQYIGGDLYDLYPKGLGLSYEFENQAPNTYTHVDYTPDGLFLAANYANRAVAYSHNNFHFFEDGELRGWVSKQDLEPIAMTLYKNQIFVLEENGDLRRYIFEEK